MDEATSILNVESEIIAVKALGSLNLNKNDGLLSRTTQIITVAQGPSTVISSDTIVIKDRDEIVEMGSHQP